MTTDQYALETALQLAVQNARQEMNAPRELTGTVDVICAYGDGIHSVIIDGDTEGTPAAAHSCTSDYIQAGSRVALLAVRPHQVWIVGEMTKCADLCRVWASVNTAFAVLNTPVTVTMDQTSFDVADGYDRSGVGWYVIRQDGYYAFDWRFITTGATSGDRFRGEIWDMQGTAGSGGADKLLSQGTDDQADGTHRVTCSGSDVLFLTMGQCPALRAVQPAGTLRAVDGSGTTDDGERVYFNIRRL